MAIIKIRKSGQGTFDICPAQFKYQYILDLPSDSGIEAEIGTFAHDAYDRWYDKLDLDILLELDGDNELLWSYMRNHLPYNTQFDFLFDNFAQFHLGLWNSYAEEDKHLFFPIMKEVKMTTDVLWDINGYEIVLSGTADAVFRQEEGYALIDYKTGRFKPWMLSKLRRDNVMYTYLLEKLHSIPSEDVKSGCLFTRYPVDDPRQFPFFHKPKPATVRAWNNSLNKILTAIKEDNFPRKRGIMCQYCNYPEMCML